MRNTLSHLLKSCAFLAAFIGTSASADTYKVGVVNGQNGVLQFSAENIDIGKTDAFGVLKTDRGCDYLEGNMTGDIVSDLEVDTDEIAFKIGSFAVSCDVANRRLKVSGGSVNDSLVLYALCCPVFVENGTSLKLNTLMVQRFGTTAFTNEGSVEAFIAYFEDCKSVENKKELSACNLFLFRSDIRNGGAIAYGTHRAMYGGIKNLTEGERKGRIKMNKNIGDANYAFDAKISQYAQNNCAATLTTASDGKVTCTEKPIVVPQLQPIVIRGGVCGIADALRAFFPRGIPAGTKVVAKYK